MWMKVGVRRSGWGLVQVEDRVKAVCGGGEEGAPPCFGAVAGRETLRGRRWCEGGSVCAEVHRHP